MTVADFHANSSMPMSHDEFWNLIAKINIAAFDRGSEEGAVLPLRQALVGKDEQFLRDFAELLSQMLYALDGEVYAQNSGRSGESDDGFLYLRCYVVAKGREFYEAALSDPRKMPKSIDQWCEALLYVHKYAWAELTGNDVSEWPFEASVSYESGSGPGWRT